MNEERQNERDSQLSAMFDGELSAAECELIARRLTRDEALRAQWSRYSLIGAALRAERGVKLDDRVAHKVMAQITQEVTYGDSAVTAAAPAAARSAAPASDRWMRFARPVFGVGIAASVAAASILFLRTQGGDTPAMVAANPVPANVTLAPETAASTVALNSPPPATARRAASSTGEPDRYSTPVPSSQTSIAPPARLANYVVAHSEYSSPLSRRMALLGLVASDSADAPAQETAPAATGTNDAH
jgi:sigma-E factor negative regulatory protein RseA